MLLHTGKVSAMAVVNGVAVETLVFHAGYSVVGRVSVAEAIRHDQVNKIPGGHALGIGGAFSLSAGFKLIAKALLFPIYDIINKKRSRCSIGFNIQIEKNIVRIFRACYFFQSDAGLIQADVGHTACIFPMDHYLQFLILHAGPPGRGVAL